MYQNLFAAARKNHTTRTSSTQHASQVLLRPLRIACGVVLAACSASSVAATHFCIAGDLDSMGPVAVAACQAKMAGVRQVVQQRGAPDGWHFVVVCDEAGWKDYAVIARGAGNRLTDAAFHTDAQLRWTFVRGSRMDTAEPAALAPVMELALRDLPARSNDAAARARATQLARVPAPAANHHSAGMSLPKHSTDTGSHS